jgi:hypothetical protein
MSVKNEIDKDVLLTVQKYDKKLNKAKIAYIEGLLNKKSPEEMIKIFKKEFTINHQYMTQEIEEITQIVAKKDKIKSFEQIKQILPNILEINPIEDFKRGEMDYAQRLINKYIEDLSEIEDQSNVTEFLTTKIKNFDENIENFIPYFSHTTGKVVSMQNLATYNSMLYNVNLTRTAWNQSYKDSILLDNEKFIINSHPFACPYCLKHQGQTFTRKEIENLVKDADVGSKEILHPNCKCTLSIYWDKSQLERQNKTTEEDYRLDQKAKAIQRKLEKIKTDNKAYKIIGNDEMFNENRKKIIKMNDELNKINENMANAKKRFYKYNKKEKK